MNPMAFVGTIFMVGAAYWIFTKDATTSISDSLFGYVENWPYFLILYVVLVIGMVANLVFAKQN